MKTIVRDLDLVSPASLTDALTRMRAQPLTPIAGFTDVGVAMNFGTLNAKRFIDLTPLASGPLVAIAVRDDVLTIGALANYTQIIQSKVVQQRLPMLAEASRQVGGVQIQNRGTLGGNIANGSPAGDTLPVLATADAILVLTSLDGDRRVPITSFYTGYRKSVLRSDEIISAVEIPRVTGGQWFRKVGTRAAQAISKLVMAGVRRPKPAIALGSVAPTVIRLPRTEAALAGGASIAEASKVLQQEIAPIDDLRSTETYRRAVAKNLLEQFWSETA